MTTSQILFIDNFRVKTETENASRETEQNFLLQDNVTNH